MQQQGCYINERYLYVYLQLNLEQNLSRLIYRQKEQPCVIMPVEAIEKTKSKNKIVAIKHDYS